MDGDIFDFVAPVIGGVIGSLVAPGIGTAIGAGIGSGLDTGIKTGDPLAGFASGALSGLGTFAGSELLGPTLSGIGAGTDAISGAATPGLLGTSFGEMAPALAGTGLGEGTLGSVIGGTLGSTMASNVGEDLLGYMPAGGTGTTGPSPFVATRQPSLGLPTSLSGMASLTPQQQASGIATEGVYGAGTGEEEQKYFLNLINNRLVDEGFGSQTGAGNTGSTGMASLSPIESSYLSKLGLGFSNPYDLLKGISTYA